MRLRKKFEGIAEGDLTPMIDMVFQLIAFFMVLVNFTESEQDDRVKLPLSELAKPPEVALEDSLTVQMTKNGDCIVAGEIYPLDGIRKILVRQANQIEAMDNIVADATIIIRAHEVVATGKVQKLIEECQQAKFEKFVLRAKEDQGY